ncbi:MAG: hypothetical protein AB4041_16290 [Microcystaceae cyanobacterium]
MNYLYRFSSILVILAVPSLPLLAQDSPVPVESVESLQRATGTSEDIQGIERGNNNWNWSAGGQYPDRGEEYLYQLSPNPRSQNGTTDYFRWDNTGEPESSGATVPVGEF